MDSDVFSLSGESGSAEVFVEKEKVNYTAKVTSNPIEKGAEIQDHAQPEPIELSWNGYVFDGDAPASIIHETILKMRKNPDLLTITGMQAYKNMVITSYSVDFSSEIENGYAFSMTLKEVELADSIREVISGKFVRPTSMAGQDKGKKTSKKPTKAATSSKKTTSTKTTTPKKIEAARKPTTTKGTQAVSKGATSPENKAKLALIVVDAEGGVATRPNPTNNGRRSGGSSAHTGSSGSQSGGGGGSF